MAIKFTSPTKHGTHTFVPSTPLAFDDAGAESYFVAASWADVTDDEPVMTYPIGTVVIDPQTTFADGPNKGRTVIQPEAVDTEYESHPNSGTVEG